MILYKLKEHFIKQTTPVIYSLSDGINYWREKILLVMFYFSLVTVGLVYVPSVIISFYYEYFVVFLIDLIGYPIVIYLYFSKTKSIKFRSYIILAYLYILSVIIIIYLGNIGAGYHWLFALAPIAAVLVGSSAAYLILVMNVLLFTILGFLGFYHFLPNPAFLFADLQGWIVIMLNFLFANILVTIAILNIIDGLQTTLNTSKK